MFRHVVKRRRWFSTAILEYDLVCMGGGSGGLACARESAKLGKKVAVLDYVEPSPAGSQWGLGGTCVNVGCIPKKLMHHAGLLGQQIQDAKAFGWNIDSKPTLDWSQLVENVQNHVRKMNFGYRAALMEDGIKYFNAKGKLQDANTILAIDHKGQEIMIRAKDIVLAVGGRPVYPDIPGKEFCITSDDIFSLNDPPGKTLIIGGSYIALETAGFLSEFGYSTTVMVRSILLRGFDQEMAKRVGDYMETHGTEFLHRCKPESISKTVDNRYQVTWKNEKDEISSDVFDTVMLATGRKPKTDHLGLENAGIQYNKNTGEVVTDKLSDATNIKNIYAIGDIVEKVPELTPVAIQAGQLLARRLYNNSSITMDYKNIATAVFTPLEYASVGLSEEDAMEKYDVEVYHSAYDTLEMQASHRVGADGLPAEHPHCYIKAICDRDDNERIVGLHICGPNAGEIIQGFAVAVRLGATKSDLSATVGVHPTQSEEFVSLSTTKSSGEPFEKTSC